MDNKWLRNSFVYLILLVAVVALFFTAFPQPGAGDNKLISINGAPIASWPELRNIHIRSAIGDTLHFTVERPTGRFETRVVVSGYSDPVVRITPIAGVTPDIGRLREAWLAAR